MVPKGRDSEIERLIARSTRCSRLEAADISHWCDCDVLNADGGTRCASITAAGIALRLAIRRLIQSGQCLPPDARRQRKILVKPPTLSESENVVAPE